jgi:hypothetical protein
LCSRDGAEKRETFEQGRDGPKGASAVAPKLPSYSELDEKWRLKKYSKGGRDMSSEELNAVQILLRGFQKSSAVRDKALAIYVNALVCFISQVPGHRKDP